MSERHYKDILYGLNENYEAVVAEISTLEDEMANQKLITIEQYFEGIVKRVENLNFTENKAIIKKAIVRIVATKQDISIWGRIPLLATPNGGTINNNESSIYANHLENEREVGLNVEHWDSEVESIPYSITFSMPEPDSGRGYSKKLVESLINK